MAYAISESVRSSKPAAVARRRKGPLINWARVMALGLNLGAWIGLFALIRIAFPHHG